MPPKRVKGRYEIKSKIGEGGTGVVYRAYDPAPMNRDVALKTLHPLADRQAPELFYLECEVLKAIAHPNIIEIFDVGEFEEGGARIPFFVMPLLVGRRLDELIRNSNPRLTVARVIDIISQACRGLQAAHERGLVHRDMKPSNIFVMDDDSVKIVDFGVIHAMDARTRSNGFQQGTLLYMAPEQVQFKTVTPQSDVFSLGVICYEALSRQQPFRGAREQDVIEAILNKVPPPVSDFNPTVSQTISRVVHQALAKQPWHRFSSARELADVLQRAFRNEPVELSDPIRIQPRLEPAQRASVHGDYQFANKIVGELEAEQNIDSPMSLLTENIEQAIPQKTISQLMESAKAHFEEAEDPIALEKIQQILDLDANHAAALELKSKIENHLSERQIDSRIRQYIANHAYGQAREALESVLRIRPMDARVSELLAEVETREQEYLKLRAEKAQIYQNAFNHWKNGEVSEALSQMGRVLELDRRAPNSSSAEGQTYQSFYNAVCCEYDAMNNAYAEARRAIAEQDFEKALAACNVYLTKYPSNARFQAFKLDIEEQSRWRLSAYIPPTQRPLEAEPGLKTNVDRPQGALTRGLEESHSECSPKLATHKRHLVNSIVLGARQTLRAIYGSYSGLTSEIERPQKKREQRAREAARAEWIKRIDGSLERGDYSLSCALVAKAVQEFTGDSELAELEKLILSKRERAEQVQRLVAAGRDLCAQGSFDEGLTTLRQALDLDERNSAARNTLVEALVEAAQTLIADDWRRAESLVQEALDLDPFHSFAKNLRSQFSDRKADEEVGKLVSLARKLQGEGDLDGAMAEVKKGLSRYPSDARITALYETLKREVAQTGRRRPALVSDLEGIKALSVRTRLALTHEIESIHEGTRAVALRYPEDAEFQSVGAETDRIARERAARTIPKQEGAHSGKPWVLPAIPKQVLWVTGAVLVVVVALLTDRRPKPAVTNPGSVSLSPNLRPMTEEAASTAPSSPQEPTPTRTVVSRLPSRLEMHDLGPGSDVIIDGKSAGKVNRRGAFSSDVPAGDHQIRVLTRYQELRVISRRFPHGSTVPLSDKDFEDKGSYPPHGTFPVRPSPGDELAWQQVKDSSRIGDLESFVGEYPNTSHRAEAQSRLEDLYWSGASNNGTISGYGDYLDRYPNGKYSQSAKSVIAKLNWEAVMSSKDPATLGDFLLRNPSGEYHDRVAERLDDLMWANTESSDVASLNTYVSRFPLGRHGDQARTQIAALTRASVPKTDKAKVERTIPGEVDDKIAVLKLVRQYQQAYQKESVDQLKTLWPNIGEQQVRALNDFFGHAQLIKLNCKLNGDPIIVGNNATVKFAQTLTYVADAENNTVSSKLIMHLRRQSSDSGMSDWRIESIR